MPSATASIFALYSAHARLWYFSLTRSGSLVETESGRDSHTHARARARERERQTETDTDTERTRDRDLVPGFPLMTLAGTPCRSKNSLKAPFPPALILATNRSFFQLSIVTLCTKDRCTPRRHRQRARVREGGREGERERERERERE